MCGIAGVVGLEKVFSEKLVRQMTQRLRHRGPDAEGIFVDETVALGHRRLSIIDLSEAANQPLFDARRRRAIVFNGEIYNYRELRKLFPEYPFRTNSDTEVILAAYDRYGADCLELLNGMFGLAIWDFERRELFLARDRLGVKPLYYAQPEKGVLVFASELRAILESGLIERRIDKAGLSEYLMYQSVYAPATVVENVFQLSGGEYAIFDGSGLRKNQFWQIEKTFSPKIEADEPEVKRKTRELLLKSVERRMISDVPLGAFLSGGIDSSAVVGLMAEVSTQPVNTFSIVFGEKEFDESPYSAMIARKFNTRHTSIELTPADFLSELPEALRAMDSPTGDGLNTYVVAKATKKSGITVALSGLGGDELFAGYPYFRQWLQTKSGFLPKMPRLFRQTLARALARSGNSRHQRAAAIMSAPNFSISNVYPMFRQVLSEAAVREFGQNGHHQIPIQKQLRTREPDIEQFPMLSQVSIAELIGYTQNVLLKDTDQFSMASALEVREPFFDFELIEYVLRIPDEYKRPKFPKSLLVESLGDLLPDAIVHRKKMGFVLPFEQWMRGELREFGQRRIENLAARGILKPEPLLERWHRFLAGSRAVRWSELWHLIVLTEWLENNKF